jgi:hypothetical protein
MSVAGIAIARREQEPPGRLGREWRCESEEGASAGREDSREEEPARDDFERTRFARGGQRGLWRCPPNADRECGNTGDRVSIVGKSSPQDRVVAGGKTLTQRDDELAPPDHTRGAFEN